MIGRRPPPVTGKLSGAWGSSSNSGPVASPKSPLDIMKVQSLKGPKKYDFGSGVGLGIVVALEKSDNHKPNKPIFTRTQSRSNE